jgi:hypothetical protein
MDNFPRSAVAGLLFGDLAKYFPGIHSYKLMDEIAKKAYPLIQKRRQQEENSKSDVIGLLANSDPDDLILDEGKDQFHFVYPNSTLSLLEGMNLLRVLKFFLVIVELTLAVKTFLFAGHETTRWRS